MKHILYGLTALAIVAPTLLPAQIPQKEENIVFQSTGRQMRWQNWAVAGGGLIAAAIGMTFIVLNQGNHPPSPVPPKGS